MVRPFGLVLAGGRSSRMGGGDKTLLSLGGVSLLSRIIARILPQCTEIAINANGDAGRFEPSPHRIIPDQGAALSGPLAGVLTGLAHLRTRREVEWLLTVPGDTPFIPPDLVGRLSGRLSAASDRIAHAQSGGRSHPLVALWHVSTFDPLRIAIEGRAVRPVTRVQEEMGAVAVEWPAVPFDPFFNINTPDDLAGAQAALMLMPDERLP